MRYVQFVAPYPVGVGERDEPGPLRVLLPAKRVVPRSVPPLIFQHRLLERRQVLAGGEPFPESGADRREAEGDRRQMCRRVEQAAVTLDTRSGHDRRGHVRRKDEHLDSSVDTEA